MIRAQKIVGAMKGDADWSKLIDESDPWHRADLDLRDERGAQHQSHAPAHGALTLLIVVFAAGINALLLALDRRLHARA